MGRGRAEAQRPLAAVGVGVGEVDPAAPGREGAGQQLALDAAAEHQHEVARAGAPQRPAVWSAQASGSAMAASSGARPGGSGSVLRATIGAGTRRRSAKAPVR